jgi:hypothetical protein
MNVSAAATGDAASLLWTCPGFVERWLFGVRVVGSGAMAAPSTTAGWCAPGLRAPSAFCRSNSTYDR